VRVAKRTKALSNRLTVRYASLHAPYPLGDSLEIRWAELQETCKVLQGVLWGHPASLLRVNDFAVRLITLLVFWESVLIMISVLLFS